MRPLLLSALVRPRPGGFNNLVSGNISNLNASQVASISGRQQYSSERAGATSWSRYPLKASSSSKVEMPHLSISSQSDSKKFKAYIALGSNLGDRVAMIERACNEMSARGIAIKRTSSLWETEPMYVLDQENFLNGACEIETSLEPLALLDELQAIEKAMERKKIVDKGPRNIDLDILLYEGHSVDHERLNIPHKGLLEREFVLRPLAELIPSYPLNPAFPWRVTVDYLNSLSSSSPLSTLTPLRESMEPLRALKSDRMTHVMAILNLTPDSFSDGGDPNTNTEYLTGVLRKAPLGASIVDVGGQSSAPGAVDITAEEEIARICPTIKRLRTGDKGYAISVDTYRTSVAEAAVEAGADIINDISAGLLDPEMLPTMARLGKTVCLMHMRGTPATMNKLTDYSSEGLIPTIAKDLLKRVAAAEAAGIRRWRIILDPGIGFAKTAEQNLEILRRIDELRDWPGLKGFPWLLGSSRKRFVGTITGVKNPRERVWGTAATVAAAVQGGADIVRVHDVEEMAQVARMSDAIWRS